jgi:hypothetical protein
MLKHFRTSTSSSSSVRMKTRFGAKDSLITNESGFVHQADSRKSRFDSVPKGQNMANAKYLRKRIALVAAAALGVGMLAAAPASALPTAVTFTTAFSATGSTTTPVAGTAVVVPVTLAASGTFEAATGIVTATLTTRPTNSALTAQDTTSSVSNTAAAVATSVITQAVTAKVAGTSGALITNSATASSTTLTAALAGQFGFTPDVAGYYVMTLTTSGTGTQSPGSITVGINASGAALVQAASGLGSATGTQVSGNQAAVALWLPAASTTTSHYQITADGGATIGSVYAGGSLADAVNANSYSSTTGITNINGSNTSAGVAYVGVRTTTSVIASGSAATDSLIVPFSATAAGTLHVYLKSVDPTSGALTLVSTTTVTNGATPTVSTQYTTAYLRNGTTFGTTPNDTVSLAKAAGVTTGQANIGVTLKDGTNANLNGQTVSVTVSGPGLVTLVAANATTAGAARVASVTLGGSVNTAQVNINADGTSGVGTFTVSVGSTVIATKSVAFYGGVSKSVATQNFAYAKAGSTLGATPTGSLAATGLLTDTPAVNVSFTDANGTAVAGVTTKMTSSNTAVIVAGTCTQITATLGTYECSVTGAVGAVDGSTATVTFSGLASDGVTYVDSAPVTFTIGKSTVATVTMAWDAATYAPGSKAVLTITAKDALGGPVADHTDGNFFTAALSSTIAVNGTLPGPSITFINGKKTVTVYVPSVPGAFTVSGTIDGVNADATATGVVSATATVTGSTSGGLSAADSAAIAAAKASADAATAAVAALSTTIASLIASITAQIRALAAQIAKLMGKSGGSTPGLPKTGKKH